MKLGQTVHHEEHGEGEVVCTGIVHDTPFVNAVNTYQSARYAKPPILTVKVLFHDGHYVTFRGNDTYQLQSEVPT